MTADPAVCREELAPRLNSATLNGVMTSINLTAPDLTAPDLTAPDLTTPDLTALDVAQPASPDSVQHKLLVYRELLRFLCAHAQLSPKFEHPACFALPSGTLQVEVGISDTTLTFTAQGFVLRSGSRASRGQLLELALAVLTPSRAGRSTLCAEVLGDEELTLLRTLAGVAGAERLLSARRAELSGAGLSGTGLSGTGLSTEELQEAQVRAGLNLRWSAERLLCTDASVNTDHWGLIRLQYSQDHDGQVRGTLEHWTAEFGVCSAAISREQERQLRRDLPAELALHRSNFSLLESFVTDS